MCRPCTYVWRRAIVVRQCTRNLCLSLSLYVFVYLCMSGKEQLWRRDNLVGIFVQTPTNFSQLVPVGGNGLKCCHWKSGLFILSSIFSLYVWHNAWRAIWIVVVHPSPLSNLLYQSGRWKGGFQFPGAAVTCTLFQTSSSLLLSTSLSSGLSHSSLSSSLFYHLEKAKD